MAGRSIVLMKEPVIRIRKINSYSFLCYFLVISILLSGNLMWNTVTTLSFPKTSIFAYLSIVLSFLLLFQSPYYNYKELRNVILIAAYLALFALSTLSTAKGYLMKYVIPMVLLILLFINVIKYNRLGMIVDAYINTILLIALVSLFFYLFGTLLGVFKGKLVNYAWASRVMTTKSYSYLYFENPAQQTSLLGRKIFRNTAIWPEAPGFASKLGYALSFMIIRKENKKWKYFVIIAALLSTLSGKSIIMLFEISVIYYLYFYNPQNKTQKDNKIILGLILGILAAVYVFFGLSHITSQSSYAFRVDSAMAGIRTWMKNVFFGSGYSNNAEILSNTEMKRISKGISMGLTTMLGQCGLYLSSFVLYPFIRLFFLFKKTDRFAWFILIAVICLTELIISNTYTNLLFMSFIAVGYAILCSNKNRKTLANTDIV